MKIRKKALPVLLLLIGAAGQAAAATFTFNRPFEPFQDWDNEVELSGNFEALDKNRDGFITTFEVSRYSFNFYADFPRFSNGFSGQSGDPYSFFRIRYDLQTQSHDMLSFGRSGDQNGWFRTIPCAEDPSDLPDRTTRLRREQQVYSASDIGADWIMTEFSGVSFGNPALCDSYDVVTADAFYGSPIVINQRGDATVPIVPLPATGWMLLSAFGLTGAWLRRRAG